MFLFKLSFQFCPFSFFFPGTDIYRHLPLMWQGEQTIISLAFPKTKSIGREKK